MTQIGDRIRQLREAARMTQQELGDVLGVTGRTVGNWETGRNSPMNSLGAIEAYFGVNLSDGTPIDADPVATAIERSDLTRAEQAELIAHYWKLLDGHEERGVAG